MRGDTFMKMSVGNLISRAIFLADVFAGIVLRFPAPDVYADQIPAGWAASNMKPIGYSELDGRGGAFKMAIRHIGDHWYL